MGMPIAKKGCKMPTICWYCKGNVYGLPFLTQTTPPHYVCKICALRYKFDDACEEGGCGVIVSERTVAKNDKGRS
jgi:hypothetical protein